MNKTAGFSILEMMIGLVVGLIVVAAATASVVNIIKSNREITDSARLNQELGAAIAVMSNEIRRAGFSVCDVDNAAFECHFIDTDGDGVGDTEDPFLPYTPGSTVVIADVDGDGNGECIRYRYNADGDGDGYDADGADAANAIVDDDDDDDLSEHRGFRLAGNVIQMAQYPVDHDATEVACGADARWVPLTDPNVVNITGLRFSTTGSRCRNNAQRWRLVVDGNNTTEMPCDPPPGGEFTCIDDPSGGNCVASDSGDQLFGNILITINLDAELTADPAVSKSLTTSVKVANPRIEDAP